MLQRCETGWGGRLRTDAAVVCALAALLGCAVDLRPGSLAPVPDAAARAAGAQQLVEVGRAHGLERWQGFSELRLRLVDTGVPRCLGGGLVPFRSTSRPLDLQLAVRDTAVRAQLAERRGTAKIVGIKGDLAYRINADGVLEFERDRCIENYLGSVQEALTLPMRLVIQSGTADLSAAAAGERSLDGRSYDLVFLSAPAPYGTSGADEQYVFWIERASSRIEWLERTDRRRSRRAREVLHYLDYREVEGVALPTRIERVGAVGASGGERLELAELKLD